MSILIIQRWKSTLILGSGLIAAALQALTLSPVNMSQHFIEPDKEVSFSFSAKDASGVKELSCDILNYRGVKSGSLTLKAGTDSRFTGTYRFPSGYYILSVPSAKQQFGFVSLPDFKKQKDYFWGANVVQRLHTKLPYIDLPELFRIMERTGIKSFRKWHSWEQEELKPGKWNSREEIGYDFVKNSTLSGLWYCNRVIFRRKSKTVHASRCSAIPAMTIQMQKMQRTTTSAQRAMQERSAFTTVMSVPFSGRMGTQAIPACRSFAS